MWGLTSFILIYKPIGFQTNMNHCSIEALLPDRMNETHHSECVFVCVRGNGKEKEGYI